MRHLIFMTILLLTAVLLSSARFPGDKKHLVKKGDTLYSLSRLYGKTVNEIATANHMTARDGIKIGQTLIIPGSAAIKPAVAVTSTPIKAFTPKSVASTPDTPYRDEDDRSRTTGKVVVEAESSDEAISVLPKPAVPGLRTSSSNPDEYPSIFSQYPNLGYKVEKLKGSANFLSESTNGNQYLAFYNQAETGSIIRITNLLNHKTIFAKVMGRVPASDASADIILKLTSSAAEQLGAEEAKFLVEVASFSSN